MSLLRKCYHLPTILPGLVISVLVLVSTSAAASAEVSVSAKSHIEDFKAIEACLNHYIEGARTHNSSESKLAFHETGKGLGYLADGTLAIATAAEYFDILDNTPAPSGDYAGRVQSISITGASAMGVVIEENDNGVDYIDYMSLAKINGEWKIIFKTRGITRVHEVVDEH